MKILERINQYRVILGSRSPRRQQLLKGLGIQFEVIVADDEDEYFPSDLEKVEIPVFLASRKSFLYKKYVDNNTLVIADTIVWIDNKVVGKPVNHDQAVDILRSLSGRKHQVLTGVCLKTISKETAFYEISDVYFRKLVPEEIDYYVSNWKPFDKAGAYGIQEWIGYIGIEKIKGSYFNIMGLPTERLFLELKKFV